MGPHQIFKLESESPGTFFLKLYLFNFEREGKGRRKKGREISMCGCLSQAPAWGPGPQLQTKGLQAHFLKGLCKWFVSVLKFASCNVWCWRDRATLKFQQKHWVFSRQLSFTLFVLWLLPLFIYERWDGGPFGRWKDGSSWPISSRFSRQRLEHWYPPCLIFQPGN